jgi:hypothetical protein
MAECIAWNSRRKIREERIMDTKIWVLDIMLAELFTNR